MAPRWGAAYSSLIEQALPPNKERTMNTTQRNQQTFIARHNSTRLAGFGLAVLMNLAMLTVINTLAQVDPHQAQTAQMAAAQPAATASSSRG